jgi:dephospho-CoA kinase
VRIVGLTGGIGAGKSSVARLLEALGAVVIDVDAIGHAVLQPGGRAIDQVIAEFGSRVLDDEGRIDRPALGRIVFSDRDALARLTAISHPAINAELVDRLDALPRDSVVVLDMAILVESNLGRADPDHSYGTVVTVEAPEETRVRRAVARGMAEDQVRVRIAAQATEAERRGVADVVIVNDGDEGELARAVEGAWRRITSGPVRSP